MGMNLETDAAATGILDDRCGAVRPIASITVRDVVEQVVAPFGGGTRPVQVLCEGVAGTSVDARVLREIVAGLLAADMAGTRPGTTVFVSVQATTPGLLITVEDDDAAGCRRTAGRPRLQRVARVVARAGGRAWVERAFDGGLAYVVLLPEPVWPGEPVRA